MVRIFLKRFEITILKSGFPFQYILALKSFVCFYVFLYFVYYLMIYLSILYHKCNHFKLFERIKPQNNHVDPFHLIASFISNNNKIAMCLTFAAVFKWQVAEEDSRAM